MRPGFNSTSDVSKSSRSSRSARKPIVLCASVLKTLVGTRDFESWFVLDFAIIQSMNQ